MAMKQWVRRLQPLALYTMLAATLVFLALQLVLAHITHALTLLVDAYHMLCNLIALAGCIITIKYSGVEYEHEPEHCLQALAGVSPSEAPAPAPTPTHLPAPALGQKAVTALDEQQRQRRRRRLMNTFGWARVDVLAMLVVCVLLASFCFTLVVEALQTLVHIGHQDEMHHPLLVLAMGGAGLLLNGVCYLLIGGYTFHQASFLHVTASGDVVLEHTVTKLSVQQGRRRLSSQSWKPEPPPPQQQPRQGPREMCRDTVGSVLVIICAVIVYFTDANVAKFVDPVLSIISAVTLLVLSYSYMKESGLILLQTIPDTIDIDSFRVELIKEFPDIINVHDLHVWRLTPSKVFCTAHIIFLNPKDYAKKSQKIIDYFQEQGITQVTVQPEFFETDNSTNIMSLPSIEDKSCLVQCRGQGCLERHCCLKPEPNLTVVTQSNFNKQHQNRGVPEPDTPTTSTVISHEEHSEKTIQPDYIKENYHNPAFSSETQNSKCKSQSAPEETYATEKIEVQTKESMETPEKQIPNPDTNPVTSETVDALPPTDDTPDLNDIEEVHL